MSRVVILQEYVPHYRVALFELLRERLSYDGIDLVIGAGSPAGQQARRADVASQHWIVPLSQREIRVAGRRVVLRSTRELTAAADLVIVEQARRNVDLYRLLLRRNHRVAVWGHGHDYVHKPTRLEQSLLRWMLARAHWFFAYTAGGAADAEGAGLSEERVTVLENAVDTRSLQTAVRAVDASTANRLRRELNLGSRTAIAVGSLDGPKRIPMLLAAAKLVGEKDPEFRLIVVGDGIERELLQKCAESVPCIRYVGPKFGSDLAPYLAVAQVIANPGRVGLVAVDSFAAARPIVTTKWPFHAPEFEYLVDDRNSVISPDDPRSFATAMNLLLRDPVRIERLAAGCDADSRRYTIEAMADNFADGIRRALAV